MAAGASGIFLAIANAQDGIMTREEYGKFSGLSTGLFCEAVAGRRSTCCTCTATKSTSTCSTRAGPPAAINYSTHGTRVPIAKVRAKYDGVIMGGIDEVNYRKLTPAELKRQADSARKAAGNKFILAPGCSVPNESTDEELERLPKVLGA